MLKSALTESHPLVSPASCLFSSHPVTGSRWGDTPGCSGVPEPACRAILAPDLATGSHPGSASLRRAGISGCITP